MFSDPFNMPVASSSSITACTNSKGSGETVQQCRHAQTIAVHPDEPHHAKTCLQGFSTR